MIRWSCWAVRKKLALLVGDDLGDEERRRVESHVRACPTCRERWASLRSSRDAMLSAFDAEDCPLALWPSVRSRIESSELRIRVQPRWLPAGAMIAASVAIFTMIWNRPQSSDSTRGPRGGARVSSFAEPAMDFVAGSEFEAMMDDAGPRSHFHHEHMRPAEYLKAEF